MKRLSFLLIIIIIGPLFSSLNGQSRSHLKSRYYKRSLPKYGFGVKAGANYASQTCVNKDVNYDVKGIFGINAGGYFCYFPVNTVAVQPELMVSVKGAHWKDAYDEMKDVLTYVELPLLVRYQPVRIFNVHAGPQFGFLVNADQKDFKTGEKTSIKSFYNDFDLGATCGVEVNLPFGLNLTLRYYLGLIAVTNEYGYIDPWKNNYLQLSAGFRISGR